MTDYALYPTTRLDLVTLDALLADKRRVVLSQEARQRIEAGQQHLSNHPANDQQTARQLLEHACGTGDEVPGELVRLMLLLKAQSLSYGHSGAQVATVQRLLDFYNREILPVVFQQGSLGAGDQVPLAHLSLPLLGLGEVNYQGYRLQAADALHLFSWAPSTLTSAEGLALLTGTQFVLAYGVHTLLRAQRLARAADVIGALSYDVFVGSREPFDERLHQLRPHAGQVLVAERLRSLLADSELTQQASLAEKVPYSFRCLPQVHGASRDALTYVAQVVETECNAVTTDPVFFPADDATLTGGNFHAQPLALALDFLAMAVTQLGSISERRTAQLLGEQKTQPLLATAASMVSQNKQLCTPASVDNSVSDKGTADHVSMGANAGTKALRVLENVEQILAIELLAAVQKLHLQRPARTSTALEQVIAAFEAKVNLAEQTQALSLTLKAALAFVRTYEWQ